MADEQVRTILGANLRKLRSRRNWSQMDLAEKADISMIFLSEIERGLKWPHPGTLHNLATALNVEVFELFMKESDAEIHDDVYMSRFSNDMAIAVELAVKKAVNSVKKQYKE